MNRRQVLSIPLLALPVAAGTTIAKHAIPDRQQVEIASSRKPTGYATLYGTDPNGNRVVEVVETYGRAQELSISGNNDIIVLTPSTSEQF